MNTDDHITQHYLAIYQEHKAAGTLPRGAKLRLLEENAGLEPSQTPNCGKISSHVNWYREKWVTDTCACGHKFKVPKGKKGTYRCNCCSNRDY